MADGMTAGHLAAKAAIKARRADLPVGLSLAIVDDVVVGDDASVRDRKRAEVYEHWLRLASRGRLRRRPELRAGRTTTAQGRSRRRRRTAVNQMGTAIEPLLARGAVRYAYEVTGVPVLVTEHGMSTDDDTLGPRSSSRRSPACST